MEVVSGKVKIAILGFGQIGKKHAEVVLQNHDYDLVALIDPKLATAELEIPSAIPTFYSLQDFISSPIKADVITVCTPNGLHFEQSKILIEEGIHVIIEKPIALRSEEAEILEQLAQDKKVHLFPVMQNRFSPTAMWLKDLIDSNVLGNLYMVQVSCFWNRNADYYTKELWRGTKSLDGGTLYTQFSHYLDLLYWLFGDLTNIQSKFADFNHSDLTAFEDSGIVTFDFDSGGMGSFAFSTSVWNENLESSLTVIAENGSVKVGGPSLNYVEKCIVKDYIVPDFLDTNLANDYGRCKGSAQNHQYLYQNIIEFLNTGKEILTTTPESIQVLKMIEKIYKS